MPNQFLHYSHLLYQLNLPGMVEEGLQQVGVVEEGLLQVVMLEERETHLHETSHAKAVDVVKYYHVLGVHPEMQGNLLEMVFLERVFVE